MTLEIEDSKNYYVFCLDVLGTKQILRGKDYNKVNRVYRFFQKSIYKVIQFKSMDEITNYILIGDSLYFICEQLKTALCGIKLFGNSYIQHAIDYDKNDFNDLPPFMIRGGISYGKIVFYHPDDNKNIYTSNQINNPFNAIGLPIGNAYALSNKSKGMRVAVDDDFPMDKYEKYFSKQCDFQGKFYYEILWPLFIFNINKDSDYIFDSFNAFWHLFEKNRGIHEIQYLSTLALFWKSVDLTSQPNIAEHFFKSKLDEYTDEVDYIRVLKKYDFFIQLKNPNKI